MEIALPHVVIRVCGPGIGPELIAALSVHPVEVSEARDSSEMNRVSAGRTVLLVVVVDPSDARSAVHETWEDLPGVPILIVSDSAQLFSPIDAAPAGWVDTVRSSQPIQDICWHVLEAVSRAARLPGLAERPLGPHLLEVDARGIVLAAKTIPDVAFDAIFSLRPGDSLASIIEPIERTMISHAIERAGAGDTQFCTVRLLDGRGLRHIVALGLRCAAEGRIAVLVLPLVCGGTIVGRHINNRDPITGLLTRWAISRALETSVKEPATAGQSAVILVSLDDFPAISAYVGHRRTDILLLGVASALNQVFPHPALTSRIMGDTFLASITEGGREEGERRAERLLQALGVIEVPGFSPPFPLRASVGVAAVTDDDPDLSIRLAEAAVAEARSAGGNRVAVAGSARFTDAQTSELTTSMDLGSWEMWLQPVVRDAAGPPAYYEALARFDGMREPPASRMDFFAAGRAQGLLERFDRMMLQRTLEMLEAHPGAKISVNVSYETFVSQSFPGSFLELIQHLPDGCRRIILEIAPRCVAGPEGVVRPRLERLAAAGVAVALDDFGSGICRLRYLTQWPLAIVKLDEMVTGYIDDDPLQRDFVRTVTSLCRARGITTVAEYTRSPEQLARLVEDGIDLFQGELFGMPCPAAKALGPAVPASV